jgi:hypothetical protein
LFGLRGRRFVRIGPELSLDHAALRSAFHRLALEEGPGG